MDQLRIPKLVTKAALPYLFLISLLLTVSSVDAQEPISPQEPTPGDLSIFFEAAAHEFQVPVDILKGIAFAETRQQHLLWAPEDTASCTGLPRAYGVMALRDDRFFGRSLQFAATLIGETPDIVRNDPLQNIRGAAAYLKTLYTGEPQPEGTVPGSIESWQLTVARYCGIPQPELAAQHAYEILQRIDKGYHEFGIDLPARKLDMLTVRATARKIYALAQPDPGAVRKTAGQPDYPPAHWAPAYPGHWYTTGNKKDFVVIHDMEGYYLSVISYFQMSTTDASVHYDVNGLQDSPSDAPAGDITQQVEEQYWAWHAVCLNRYSFGIEHEGFVSNPAWWTPEMYKASANLVKHLCDVQGIPKDRNHIIGHNEYLNSTWLAWAVSNGYPSTFGTCNNHTDPGVNWDWGFFMQLITGDMTPPRITSTPPVSRVQVFDKISITFNQRLEKVAAEQNFRISPTVQGTFAWTNGFRTLEFIPSAPLGFDTEYSAALDTGAHNYLGVGLDVNGDGTAAGEVYGFTFRTVENDTTPPAVLATYPVVQQNGISTTVQFEVDVNEPVDPATLAGAFLVQDAVGNSIVLTSPSVQTIGTGRRIGFRPVAPLAPSAAYTLTIQQSLRDYGGNGIAGPHAIPFITGGEQGFLGTVINNLDAAGSWWQPGSSGSTVGTSTSSFTIVSDIRKSGTGSGKVSYVFSGPGGGTVREYNSLKPSVEPGPLVSAWVFGDNSRNALEFWFYPLTFIRVDTLDWTGWKLVSASLASVPTTAERQFAGFVIQQLPGARTSGAVYFDDLAVTSVITDAGHAEPALPKETVLFQNYPNPFNPTTTIRFGLPQKSHVTLSVFNALGQQVALLVEGDREAGYHDVRLDGGGLASGVYFYRIRIRGSDAASSRHSTGSGGEDIQTRKFVLLR
jgi:hypothetical protein